MRRNVLRKKSLTLAALAALTITVPANAVTAAANTHTTAAAVTAASSEQVVQQYEALLKSPAKAIVYLNAHIDEVTPYQAGLMVLKLENAIRAGLPAMEKRFFPSSVQAGIDEVYRQGDLLGDVRARTTDQALKALLYDASVNGYKLETGEGMFYPIINYSIFKRYQAHVSADIEAYISIMAEESRKASLKDAALAIGYQELVHRTLAQEHFIRQYPNSNRYAQVKQLFGNYASFTFYGTNNTPLFDYDTNEMQPNAKIGYGNILKWNEIGSSAYLSTLQEFMDLLAEQEYRNTAKVREFLSANLPIQ